MNITELLEELCKANDITISGLEKKLGYGNGSLAKAKNIPYYRIAEIADYFGVSTDYFNRKEGSETSYYFDDECAEMADFMHKNQRYKTLFKAVRKIKPEDMDFVQQFIERTANYDD